MLIKRIELKWFRETRNLKFWRLNYSFDGPGCMVLCSTYASVDVSCWNNSLRDKSFILTSPTSLQIILAQSYTLVYLRSCMAHAEIPSLYIKVIILALVILFAHISFLLNSLHGLLQHQVPVCSPATTGVPLKLILSICMAHKVVLQLLL